MTTQQLVRPMDAARELNANPPRIYAAIRRGTLRTYKFGGVNMVDLADVRAYLEFFGRRSPYQGEDKSA